MRTIKFRAWDKESSEMLYSEKLGGVHDLFLDFNNEGLGLWMQVEYNFPEKRDAELMQFTDILDKNGKEIYEGDVVKYEIWEQFHGVKRESTSMVEFKEKWAGWWPMVANTVVDDGFYNYEIENVEVIGNIYENPNLLN